MIDFVKVRPNQSGLAVNLRADSRLIWTDQINSNEQRTGIKATHHGLTWYVANSGFVEITGSLHKCWNSINGRPPENWNDFRRLDLFDVLNWLAQEFGLDLNTTTVHNIEFGVNLTLPPAPPTVRDLLSKLLFYGSAKPFTERPVKRGYYKRLDSSDFYIKAYDKGTQYNTPDQRLRFEKGIKVMKNINNDNPVVVTLADLNQPARLDQLGNLLLDTFERCFWAEDFTGMSLKGAQQKTVEKAHNVAYVASLTPTQRTRLKGAYDQIANRLNCRLSTDLRAQISAKWKDLLEVDCNVLQRGVMQGFTRLENVVKPYNEPPIEEVTNQHNNDGTMKKGPVPERRTKRPTATQLRANPDLLAEVEKGRKQYAKGSKENRFERAAHNLRDDDSNPRNNLAKRLRKLIDRAGNRPLPLFAPEEVIRLTPNQRAMLDYWKGTRWEIRLGK